MTLILIIDLPRIDLKTGPSIAQQFVDALVESSANDDAIIHTITSLVPHTLDTRSQHA